MTERERGITVNTSKKVRGEDNDASERERRDQQHKRERRDGWHERDREETLLT